MSSFTALAVSSRQLALDLPYRNSRLFASVTAESSLGANGKGSCVEEERRTGVSECKASDHF